MFSGQCRERILLLEKLGESVNENCLTEAMAEIGISQEQLGSGIDLSQKQVFTILRSDKTERKQKLVLALKVEIKRKVADSKRVFGQILKNSPENIEWDKIKSIKEMKYFGPIIDLQVPGYYNFIAGLGGIVSHNTSLTKALTGKWCDTHSEEMKRGISIRLGYADTTFYKLKTNNGIIYSNDKNKGTVVSERLVSFVDAPGHETLMTTMLSGAALMNGAVLVIAANEICPQPRTVEHLMALKFAGVEKIVVAQNKVDLVDAERAKQQQGEIKKFLKEYGYENAPIIPTVANFGTNIDYLIEAIETRIPTPKYELNKGLKMFVARSFDINRPGTKVREMKGAVVGGSITQGKIKLGDEVQLYPGIKGKTITKVISLATDSGMLNEAVPGGLIAVGTEIDPSMGQNDRLRGQIVGKPGSMPEPTKVVLLKLNPFERVVATDQKAEIKSNDIIVLTIGTNTAIGTAAQSAGGKVIVSLKNEVVAEKGEKVAVSKNLNNQWRLVAYGEVL
jgi:translation initiation factor 2 subunit 3